MTLIEISSLYTDSAAAIRTRIRQLEWELNHCSANAEELKMLRFRIQELTPLLREMREMAFITAHYYDR